jgi:hypothetical protein
MLLFPVFFALHIDEKKNDHPITSNLKLLTVGSIIGSLLYLGLYFLGEAIGANAQPFPWNLYQISGIVLPVLFGFLVFFIKSPNQFKSFRFTRGGIGAGIFYLLFSAIPIGFPWLLFWDGIRVPMIILIFPVFFGLWVLLNVSNYTWRYFLTYAILSILSSLINIYLVYAASVY